MTTPDAAVSKREFTFGSTRCFVEIHAGPRRNRPTAFAAHVFVVEDHGRALRRVGDRQGAPVVYDGDSAEAVLALAALYLERRFGRLSHAPVPEGPVGNPRPIREPVLREV